MKEKIKKITLAVLLFVGVAIITAFLVSLSFSIQDTLLFHSALGKSHEELRKDHDQLRKEFEHERMMNHPQVGRKEIKLEAIKGIE
jgi:hypothetical protein